MDSLLKEAWNNGYASIKEYLESLKKEAPIDVNYEPQEEEPDMGERSSGLRGIYPSDMEPEFGI